MPTPQPKTEATVSPPAPAVGTIAPGWLSSQLQPGEHVLLLLGPSLWMALFRRARLNLLCWLVAALAFPLASWGLLPVQPASLAAGAVGVLAFSLLLGVISCAAEHYILTDTRLVVIRGVASRRSVQVRWGDIREIAHLATWWQRPLGLSDIQVLTAAPSSGCLLRYVRAAHIVSASLEQQRIAATRSRQQGRLQSPSPPLQHQA